MKNHHRMLPLSVAVAALAIGASQPASAGLITSSSAFTANETISLNKFDSSLGTLTGVSLTVDSSWQTSLEVDYDGPEGRGFPTTVVGQSSHSVTVANLFGGSGTVMLGNLDASCDFFGEGFYGADVTCDTPGSDTDFGDLDGDIGVLFSVAPAYTLSHFLGGGTFNFDLNALASENFCNRSGDTLLLGDCTYGTTWNGTVTVAYTYREPNPAVPLPGTLVLLGIGLAGMGWRRCKA